MATKKTGNGKQLGGMETRSHFMFFRSFQEAIDQCDEKDQLSLYRGIVNYALYGKESVFDNPLLKMAWTLIKPNLEKGLRNWKNGCKGGAPTDNQNARKTTQKQPKNNRETTQKQRDKDKDKDKDKEKGIKNSKESKPKKDVSLSPSTDYSNFLEWLKDNCPHLLKMKIPTDEEYNKLLDLAEGSKNRLTDKLLAMEDNKRVPKERRSIYRTCGEWLKRDKKQ